MNKPHPPTTAPGFAPGAVAPCATGHHPGVNAKPGSWLCETCTERIWEEVGWLAEGYRMLGNILTGQHHGSDDHVVVAGGKDPLVTGVALDDAVARARSAIHSVATRALALYTRGGGVHVRVPDSVLQADPGLQLLWIKYRLGWLERRNAADPAAESEIKSWAAALVAARIAADNALGGPKAVDPKIHTGLPCTSEGCDGNIRITIDAERRGKIGVCTRDPRHAYTMGAVLRMRAHARRAELAKGK